MQGRELDQEKTADLYVDSSVGFRKLYKRIILYLTSLITNIHNVNDIES